MPQAKHPWKDREWDLYAGGASLVTATEDGRRIVADIYGEGRYEFAAFLVRAANSHEQLVQACRAALESPELIGKWPPALMDQILAALAAAEGDKP